MSRETNRDNVTLKEVLIAMYLLLSFIGFVLGCVEGSEMYYEESCKPNSVLEYAIPSYSLGCMVARPLHHYKRGT